MSDSNIVMVFSTPRRTHTGKSVTIREAGILGYLLPKMAKSSPPKGFECDSSKLRDAFELVGRFAYFAIAEAKSNLPLLQQVAATGDEEAMKAYSSAKKALAAIEEQVRAGKLDDLIAIGRKAEREAEVTIEALIEAAPAEDDSASVEDEQPAERTKEDILLDGDVDELCNTFTRSELNSCGKVALANAIIAARS